MDFLEAIRTNLLSPAVLFFALGVIAALYLPVTIYLSCAT